MRTSTLRFITSVIFKVIKCYDSTFLVLSVINSLAKPSFQSQTNRELPISPKHFPLRSLDFNLLGNEKSSTKTKEDSFSTFTRIVSDKNSLNDSLDNLLNESSKSFSSSSSRKRKSIESCECDCSSKLILSFSVYGKNVDKLMSFNQISKTRLRLKQLS